MKKLVQKNFFIALFFVLSATLYSHTISAQCAASFTFTQDINAKKVTFYNSSTPTTGKFYYWRFGDNTNSSVKNPTHTYAANANYTVCLIVYDSLCMDSICRSVDLSFYWNCFQITDLRSYQLSDSMTFDFRYHDYAGVPQFTPGVWTYNDTVFGYYGFHFPHKGVYNICYTKKTITGADTCITRYCKNFSIPKANCISNFNIIKQPSNALGRYYQSLNVDTTLSYTWTYGDSTTGTGKTAFHLYSKPGIYTVCLKTNKYVINDSCETIICKQDTVSASCVANFTYNIPNINNPRGINFVYSGGSANVTISWNFGDGTVPQLGTPKQHFFPYFTTYTVCATVKSLIDTTCTNTICKNITIRDTTGCGAYFNQEFADTIHNTRLRFFPQLTFDSLYRYQWKIDDTLAGNTFAIIKDLSYGNHIVCLKATRVRNNDTCVAQVCDTIHVGCQAYFYFNQDNTQPNKFSFNGSFSHGLKLNYAWDFGSGIESNAANPIKIFSTGGNKNVCLRVWSSVDTNCQSVYCKTLTVGCYSHFTKQVDPTNPMRLIFKNQSIHDTITTYLWDFGDGQGSTAFEPTHTYANIGFNTVCLTTYRNGSPYCIQTFCDSFLVGSPACVAYFAVDYTASPSLHFLSSTPGSANMLYNWSFGDGGTSLSKYPFHTYPSADSVYRVCLSIRDTVQTLCADTYCRLVYINRNTDYCTGKFNQSLDSLYMGAGFRFIFNPLTAYNFSTAQYLWSFGDGDSSTLRNPMHIYNAIGNYTVCLSILNTTNQCAITDCKLIHVPDSIISSTGNALLAQSFKAYPNPVSDELTLEIGEQFSKALNYSIIDMQGREMAQGSIPAQTGSRKTTLSVQHLPKGVYIVRVGSEGAYYYHKLLK
ncbi:MAG: hypothetical protein CFE21_17305 [Bacteroidetes bacterium B1(2017)]|nr:MAG: hypothetical protein CFE21_17305 [Bacteroidetes bacterium B1(2017)]